jgi:hypothetical protein
MLRSSRLSVAALDSCYGSPGGKADLVTSRFRLRQQISDRSPRLSPGEFVNYLQLIAPIDGEGDMSGERLFHKPQSARALPRAEKSSWAAFGCRIRNDTQSLTFGGIACVTHKRLCC